MLRLVSFPRNSHVLRHLLSIKFADEGTAVTITLAYAKAVAWSRHATGERVQQGNDTTGSVTSMQFLFANNYSDKARESEFILDKLEGFFALHLSIFSLESFESKGSFLLQKCKHQLLRSLFQPTHGKKQLLHA